MPLNVEELCSATSSELAVELEEAKRSEDLWVGYRRSLQAELYKRYPVPDGKASKTRKDAIDGFSVESKSSTTTKVNDVDLANKYHKLYPDAFPSSVGFSRKGFKDLPAETQKAVQLSGAIVTTPPYQVVNVKRLED